MPAIMIDGRPLDELSLRQIVTACANPARPFFEGGSRMDYFRNVDVLKLFGEAATLDAEAIAERYFWHVARGRYSDQFDAMRAGELVAWAITQRLVEIEEGPQWRLVETERVFELCGPEAKQIAVRVRGLTGVDAVAADKIWQREQKRRERARVKRVGVLANRTREMAEYIGTHEPATKLPPDLQRFAVAGVDTIIGCSELIVGSMTDMSVADADTVADAVRKIWSDVHHRIWEAGEAERRRQREEEKEAMDAIALAFAPPPAPPAPPRPPYPANVRSWWVKGGYMGSDKWEVTGSREDVETTIQMIRERCNNVLNWPYFPEIEDLGDGQFRALGSMDRGTD